MSRSPATSDAWHRLRELTPARLALGRSGVSLPTEEVLRFSLAHAQARDAVHEPLDVEALRAELIAAGFSPVTVTSRAEDRAAYLRRPDWGRRLSDASVAELAHHRTAGGNGSAPQTKPAPLALAFVIADGLSSKAAQRHSLPLLLEIGVYIPHIRELPLVIATQARVALGDEIGQALGAVQVAVLIGERPGLSSPDSLGLYLTHTPQVGRTDAERNCLSNIRPEGLNYGVAARKLAALIAGARRLGRTGVDLKDYSDALPPDRPFLALE